MQKLNTSLALHLIICFMGFVFLTACASSSKPLVDMKGVNEKAYEADLKECQEYAAQSNQALPSTAKGAGIGAAVGGTLGLILGGTTTGVVKSAAVGAVVGGGTGAYRGTEKQDGVVKKCLSGRGYKVLN